MINKIRNKIYVVIITGLAILISIAGIRGLFLKADLPFTYEPGNRCLISLENYWEIETNIKIIKINNFEIPELFAAETILDSYKKGDTVNLTLDNNKVVSVTLVPYYRTPGFILISIIVSFLFLLTGLVIYLRDPEDKQSFLFYLTFQFLAIAIASSIGYYGYETGIAGKILRILHYVFYILSFIFLLETVLFVSKIGSKKIFLGIVRIFAVTINIVLCFLLIKFFIDNSVDTLEIFYMLWNITKGTIFILTLSSILILYIEYKNIEDGEQKRKVKWMLFSIIAGALPYVAFYILPTAFGIKEFISEDFLLVFLIIIPVSYTFGEGFEIKRLEEINKEKSYLISTLSHELQTPLTIINLYTESILNDVVKEESRKKEYLKTILGESNRLSNMIKNLLNLGRIERGVKEFNFQTINLAEILDYTLNLMEYEFKKNNFELKADIKERNCYISGDKDAVQQIILNLLSNAIKYSGDSKKIETGIYLENNIYVIYVRDYGKGISAAEQQRIFEKYYRTEEGKKLDKTGTGIGLSVVKYFVDAHKGNIELESSPDSGTTFKIKIKKGFKNEEDINYRRR